MNPFHDCVAKRLGALATLTELNPEKESELRICLIYGGDGQKEYYWKHYLQSVVKKYLKATIESNIK